MVGSFYRYRLIPHLSLGLSLNLNSNIKFNKDAPVINFDICNYLAM
jgi:hypothetical protein